MRFKSLWVIGLLLGAVLFAANWGGRAQVPVRKTWEYKAVTAQYGALPPTVSEQELNRLGAEGWELVESHQVVYPQGGTTQHRTDYYFKRVR